MPLGLNFFHHEKARIQKSLHAVCQAALLAPRESRRGRARDALVPEAWGLDVFTGTFPLTVKNIGT